MRKFVRQFLNFQMRDFILVDMRHVLQVMINYRDAMYKFYFLEARKLKSKLIFSKINFGKLKKC